MTEYTFSNGRLRVVVTATSEVDPEYFVERVEWNVNGAWRILVIGDAGKEFVTSLGSMNAAACESAGNPGDGWVIKLTGNSKIFDAEEIIEIVPDQAMVRRKHTYRFHEPCQAAITPGWRLHYADDVRYTYALRAHEQPLAGLPMLRSDIAWALPFPFHVWHTDQWIALYGIDRRVSAGTLEFSPQDAEGHARLNVYFPDCTEQPAGFGELPRIPGLADFQAGDVVILHDILMAQPLQVDQEPLLEAERIATSLLLDKVPERDAVKVADGIADYLDHCELWDPDAFGAGRGWFLNMWVYTQAGTPKKHGSASGYYDLGWGEGIAVEIILAAIRHWNRTGNTQLLRYVNEMTPSINLFKRGAGDDQPYFDRSDGARFGDFGLDYMPPGHHIWTHSLGHTGSQLIQAYQESEGYPDASVRDEWLTVAKSIAGFFTKHQRTDGDLQDIFDDEDRELNRKPHRIAARAVVCGLWARLAQLTGDNRYTDCALRLAHAVSPDINVYAYYNQMIDGLGSADMEFMDGEAAYYVLEGLAPLYALTRDVGILSLCRKAAAFGIAWTYFFDLPHGNNGVTRGGQCCRMPDYPLLYPIGPAKAIEPLLSLHQSTGDGFYGTMATEMAQFIAAYQWECPGKPWHGGMIHAIDQASGKHWGPDKCGQVDSGMASANSLAALEAWMRYKENKSA